MKNFMLLFIVLCSVEKSFAQLNASGSAHTVFVFSLGAHETFISNPGFDSWTELNYNKKINSSINIDGDLTVVLKKADLGLQFSASYPYGVGGLYYGIRLTSPQSKISSFLNLEIGEFFSHYKNMPPVGYTPTPNQQGQQLELHYEATYIGLSSKNYLNNLHIHIGKKNKGISLNSGFFAAMGYEPFKGGWSYGYYTYDNNLDGNVSNFNDTAIKTIPKLNNVFIDMGIFIGIGN